MKKEKVKENRKPKLVLIVSLVMVLIGVTIMPKAVVYAILPAEGAAYFNKLVAGLWCFKIALVLSGMLVYICPIVLRRLNANMIVHDSQKAFSAILYGIYGDELSEYKFDNIPIALSVL